MNNLNKKVFVISLKNSIERREYITKLFNLEKINFEFFDAVNGKEMKKEIYSDNALNPGEIGCLLSHLNIYKRIVDLSINQSLIFEDDVEFEKNFPAIYHKWINDNSTNTFDLLKLGYADGVSFDYKKKISTYLFTRQRKFGIKIKRPFDKTYGSFAYIITKSGAEKLINIVQSNIKPIDVILHESPSFGVNLFISEKQFCFPNFSFDSIIREEHKINKSRPSDRKKSLIKRILIRLHLFQLKLSCFLKGRFNIHLK